jgi:hypothetical protein
LLKHVDNSASSLIGKIASNAFYFHKLKSLIKRECGGEEEALTSAKKKQEEEEEARNVIN